MSTRAIRALRGDKDSNLLLGIANKNEDESSADDDDEDDDDYGPVKKSSRQQQNRRSQEPKRSQFTFIADESDDDEEDDEEDDDDRISEKSSKNNNSPLDSNNDYDNDKNEEDNVAKSAERTIAAKQSDSDNDDDDNSDDDSDQQEEEDIDAILNEFQQKDMINPLAAVDPNKNGTTDQTIFTQFGQVLLNTNNYNSKDLDYDYSMRTSLLYNEADNTTTTNNRRKKKAVPNRNSTKNSTYIFSQPRNGWVRPPHLIGGGMGLKCYTDPTLSSGAATTTQTTPATNPSGKNITNTDIPWPYNDETVLRLLSRNIPVNNNDDPSDRYADKVPTIDDIRRNFYTFVHSDVYHRDCNDYFSIVQQSGDTSALLMFVAHHPFCCPALLQLSSVLYQTNHTVEGLALLQRCLFVLESSMTMSFKQQILNGYDSTITNGSNAFFVDSSKVENKTFFDTLQKLIQVSCIAGLSRTSLATCRLVLSMDPLRDPMGILLIMDRFVLATDSLEALQWFVDLIDSNKIPILHQWDSNSVTKSQQQKSNNLYNGSLLDLPNIVYSYALALYKISTIHASNHNNNHDDDNSTDEYKLRADTAIRVALRRFPNIVGRILKQLDIDITGRSFRRDWVPVLEYTIQLSRDLDRSWSSIALRFVPPQHHEQSSNMDPVVYDTITLSATKQACDIIIKNYVLYCSKFWNDDETMQWMYNNLRYLQNESQNPTPNLSDQEPSSSILNPPNPAIIKYLDFDWSVYDDKIIQLPPEVAMLDPGLLEYATMMNTNRGRFVRHIRRNQPHHQQQQHAGDGNWDQDGNWVGPNNNNRGGLGGNLLGPPNHIIDPDWPIVEVFWRSFLPWNHVDGVPAPPPPPR